MATCKQSRVWAADVPPCCSKQRHPDHFHLLACTPQAQYFPVLSPVQLPSSGTLTGAGEKSSGTAMSAPVAGST